MKPKYLAYYVSGALFYLFKPVLDFHLRLRSPKLHRFYSLDTKISKAYRGQEFEKVEALALEYLELAKHYRGDWNYGNAIHSSHTALGLIHLRREDVEAAKKHLIAAGRTPGSPQLDSYGPPMRLARELLQRGEKQVVLKYLDLVAKFWLKNDLPEFHKHTLEKQATMQRWKTEVEQGRIPDKWN